MSTESAILIELQDLRDRLDRIAARLDVVSPSPYPDRLKTTEAVLYVRHAHHWPAFSPSTLYRWLAAGRITDLAHPRRWLREELDRCCVGTPVMQESRGARRS